jgi:hypothetical protein
LIRQRLKAALGRPVSEVLADAQLFPVQS